MTILTLDNFIGVTFKINYHYIIYNTKQYPDIISSDRAFLLKCLYIDQYHTKFIIMNSFVKIGEPISSIQWLNTLYSVDSYESIFTDMQIKNHPITINEIDYYSKQYNNNFYIIKLLENDKLIPNSRTILSNYHFPDMFKIGQIDQYNNPLTSHIYPMLIKPLIASEVMAASWTGNIHKDQS